MTTTSFKRTNQAIFAEVGSDVVALNIERGSSYGMEDVAATIWRLLEEPMTTGQLCDNLVGMYDVDRTRCCSDVEALLADLESEGLVERCHQT
jgi:hypothetical protein